MRAKSRFASDVLIQAKVARSSGVLTREESTCAITSIIMLRRTSERLESESRAARMGVKLILPLSNLGLSWRVFVRLQAAGIASTPKNGLGL
jgi:hypothetical protein